MVLTLKTRANKETYTIGHLFVDGEYFCDTLEDTNRGLNDNMSTAEILKKKVKDGHTARNLQGKSHDVAKVQARDAPAHERERL